MVKVISIVENDSITGVKYGLVEANEPVVEISRATAAYKAATQRAKKHKSRTHQKMK